MLTLVITRMNRESGKLHNYDLSLFLRRVGSNRAIPINARIIAATHRNLKAEIEKGTFREDLYYRLNVINVQIPPLRDRTEDR